MVQSQRNTVGAVILIALGVLFLVGQVFEINVWSMMGVSWPVFVIIPGVLFLALAFMGDKRASGFAVPGMIITGTGAILWYQNVTDNWQSWAYVWTLYPVFVGLALMFMGARRGNEKEYHTGRGFVNFGLVAFVVGAAFFEGLIFHGSSPLTGWLLPLALIGAGGFLLVSGRSGWTLEKRKLDDAAFAGRSNGRLSHSDDLQRKIDEAINEDDPKTKV